MTRKELEERYLNITRLILDNDLKKGLDHLADFLRTLGRYDLFSELETIGGNYKTLVKYAAEGLNDPRRQEILAGIKCSALQLADETWYYLSSPWFPFRTQERMTLTRKFSEDHDKIVNHLEEFFFHNSLSSVYRETGISAPEEETPGQADRNREEIFKLIWLTPSVRDVQMELGRRINLSGDVPWQDKCLVVSALTLSNLNWFDDRKFHLMLDYLETREEQVWQRALVGLILGLLRYDRRVALYPGLVQRLEDLSTDPGFQGDIEMVLTQLMKARETEKVTKEFEQEVLPDMKKMMPRLEDKLQLDDPGEHEDLEGKNPGWKGMMEEVPGLYEKIEKYTRLQMEGTDVFMSTFSMLKRFDFFNRMSNWFIPFYRQHPALEQSSSAGEGMTDRLLETLEKAFYICNSDKYSFALNFQAIPQQQRTMIITHFEAELQQMKEMATEEQILDQSLTSNAVIIHYIQDLYRFFKLFPNRNEFDDPFQQPFYFSRYYFYTRFFDRSSLTERLAEFFFEREHFSEAISLYTHLLHHDRPKGEIYEKIGYGFQKSGMFRQAIEHYKKAELFDTNRLWILKKLGWCSLKLEEYEEALTYFQEALKEQPDDLTLLSQTGQCFLGMKAFEDALRCYMKADFLAPGRPRYQRALAWCYFVMGKPAQAEDIYRDILASNDPTPYDLMNAAHVKICIGKRPEALELYREAISSGKVSQSEFLAAFSEDLPWLIKNGIDPDNLPLLRDFLLYHTNEK